MCHLIPFQNWVWSYTICFESCTSKDSHEVCSAVCHCATKCKCGVSAPAAQLNTSLPLDRAKFLQVDTLLLLLPSINADDHLICSISIQNHTGYGIPPRCFQPTMFKFCNIQPWYHQQSRSMPGRRAWFGSVSCRRLGGPENLPHLWSETPWSIGIEMQMPIIAVFWYLRNSYCYKFPSELFTQTQKKDPFQSESFHFERKALHPGWPSFFVVWTDPTFYIESFPFISILAISNVVC